MGRPLSSAFRAIRDLRHPVKGNGAIMGARPLPGFAGICAGNHPEHEGVSEEGLPDFSMSDDPALMAFVEDEEGTVPIGFEDPGSGGADQFDLFDPEEFDYDPLGLGLSIA